MLYLLTKPHGFMEQPKMKSMIRAMALAEGTHLFIYNDNGSMLCSHDLANEIRAFIIENGDDDHKEALKHVDGFDLISLGLAVGGRMSRTNRKLGNFTEYMVWLGENVIRDAKGLPTVLLAEVKL